MVFVGILLIVLGLAFGALGYLIAFRRKYALINHFVDDKNRGKFDDAFAEAEALEKKLAAREDVGPLAGVPVGLKDFLPSKKGWTNSKRQ